MGDLDDAIREHLELKRRHGATEEEVATKEREARRQGALPTEPGAPPDEPVDEVVDTGPALEEPDAGRTDTSQLESPDEPVVSRAPAPVADELEPDEVLPEEALDAGIPPAELPGGNAEPAPDWSPPDLPEDPEGSGEDVLEETPDFLEGMPEQDRLWFEQRPPKDFDFDD
jgi:hypothetical protein